MVVGLKKYGGANRTVLQPGFGWALNQPTGYVSGTEMGSSPNTPGFTVDIDAVAACLTQVMD